MNHLFDVKEWSFSKFVALIFIIFYNTNVLSAELFIGQIIDGSLVYSSPLSEKGLIKTIQIRTVYSTPRMEAGLNHVRSSRSVEEIDCQNISHTTKRLALYDNSDSSGLPIWSNETLDAVAKPKTIDLMAKSAITRIYTFTCLGAWHLGSPSPNTQAPTLEPSLLQTPTARPPFFLPSSTPPPPQDSAPPQVEMPSPSSQVPAMPSPSSISMQRPFKDSVFTLGLMGQLAEFVYFDDEEYQFLLAMQSKLRRGYDRIVTDGNQHPLIEFTYKKLSDKTIKEYEKNLAIKSELLAKFNLISIPLPNINQNKKPIRTFHAEMYRHTLSGERILVFRGTKKSLDWISNIWIGIDLLQIEAPHYAAARELMEALIKNDKFQKNDTPPIVIGHSLGAGMAQYVGAQFGLKVVGFNSSPLPARYIPKNKNGNLKFIRLFSAVEQVASDNGLPTREHPDPVSIRIPNIFNDINQELNKNYFKAHQHLIQLTCVASIPTSTATDYQQNQDAIDSLVQSTIKAGLFNLYTDRSIQIGIKKIIGNGLSDPVWKPDLRTPYDLAVANAVKDEIENSAIELYKEGKKAVEFGKGLYSISKGRYVSTLKKVSKALSKYEIQNLIKINFLNPHNMARFNRGMLAEVDSDVFLANPTIAAHCKHPSSTY